MKALAAGATFTGVTGLVLSAADLEIAINQGQGAGNDTVVDYSSQSLAVNDAISLDFDGGLGALLIASGTMEIDLYGFFLVSGSLAVERTTRTLKVINSDDTTSDVEVELLTIGGEDLTVFAGVNGGTANSVGLSLAQADFGLAMAVDINDSSRSWVSLSATAAAAAVVGMDELTITADTIAVQINREATDGSLVDYKSLPIEIRAGPGATQTLDLDGSLGALLRVSGNLDINLFNFFQVTGTFAFEKYSSTVTLSDDTTVNADILTLGAANVSAFAGLNGDTADRTGFSLSNINLGLAIFAEQGTNRSWTSLRTTSGTASFTGMTGIDLAVSGIEVVVNQASQAGAVVDFAAAPFDVPSGNGSAVTLNMAGDLGELLSMTADFQIGLFNFFHVSGVFALEKMTRTQRLSTGEQITADLLTIGAENITGFAGINYGSGDQMGLTLTDLDFGFALLADLDDPSRQYAGLKASVDSVVFSGFDKIQMSGDTLNVEINRAAGDGSLMDFSFDTLDVVTGIGSTITLDMDSGDGELLRATGHLSLEVMGFFMADGSFAFEKSAAQVTVDGADVDVDLLTMGADNVSAFAGVKGGTDDAIGFSLTDTEFGLAIVSDQSDPSRKWTTLYAAAASLSFSGLNDVLLESDSLAVKINTAATDDSVIDYSATPLEITTGPGTSVVFDMAGDEGEQIRASGNLTLDLFNFFTVSGSFAINKQTATLTLSDATEIDADLLTIGASDVSAFVGLNGGTANALGLTLSDVDFALALIAEQGDTGQWTTLYASAGSAWFTGVDGLVLDAALLEVSINQAQTGTVVVDYGAALLEIGVAPAQTLTFDMDGAAGEILEASGSIRLELFNFFSIQGSFGFQKFTDTVTLSGGSEIQVDVLTMGAEITTAFAGLNSGTGEALGLELTGGQFALAMMADQSDPSNSYTALKADADSAAFIGVDGIELTTTALEVLINQGDAAGQVVDFGTDPMAVSSVAGDMTLDMPGTDGEVIQASGQLSLGLFDFFSAAGTFALKKSSAVLSLSDGTAAVGVDLLEIGAHVDTAFAGINGGTGDAVGFTLTNVDFGLAFFKPVDTTDTRSWTAMKASVGAASIAGLSALAGTSINTIQIEVNRAADNGVADDGLAVVNFLTSFETAPGLEDGSLAVATGNADENVGLDFSDAFVRVTGNFGLNVLGAVTGTGTVSVKFSKQEIQIRDTGTGDLATVNASVMEIGAFNLTATIGEPGNNVTLAGVDLGIALFTLDPASAQQANDLRSWVAVKTRGGEVTASAGGAASVGATDIRVTLNKGYGTLDGVDNAAVVDFKASFETGPGLDNGELAVFTGGYDTAGIPVDLILDFDAQLLEFGAALSLEIGDFFFAGGAFSFTNLGQRTITLSDGVTTVDVTVEILGAGGITAFAGVNGPYINDDGSINPGAMGLSLYDVDFAYIRMTEVGGAGRFWYALKAVAGSAGLVGGGRI